MRALLGFAAGVAATWAALAIWQHIPPMPDFEPDGDPELYLPRRGDRRTGFDPDTPWHDRGCRYPRRPCVCSVTFPSIGR